MAMLRNEAETHGFGAGRPRGREGAAQPVRI